MVLNSVDKILDFAIRQEEEAADFYTDLSGKAKTENMRQVFLDFAAEENGHKDKLAKIKAGGEVLSVQEGISDLKIGDYLEEVGFSKDLDYQDALILAINAEKTAFKLYSDLASIANDPGLKAVLLGLAQEEANHKLRFEMEYDDRFLKDN